MNFHYVPDFNVQKFVILPTKISAVVQILMCFIFKWKLQVKKLLTATNVLSARYRKFDSYYNFMDLIANEKKRTEQSRDIKKQNTTQHNIIATLTLNQIRVKVAFPFDCRIRYWK